MKTPSWTPTPEVKEWIRAKFSYEPNTGLIRDQAGNEVGFRKVRGYTAVSLHSRSLGLNKQVTAHRLAWFLHHGEWPELDIDHINHDGFDNRIENLRLATIPQNRQNNSKKRANNRGMPCSSKYKGVYRKANRWVAQIRQNTTVTYLGCFETEEEAAEAYRKASAALFGEYAYQVQDSVASACASTGVSF